MSSKFSSNSEANASELLDNLKEILPRYYMHGDVQTLHHIVLPVCKELRKNMFLRNLSRLLINYLLIILSLVQSSHSNLYIFIFDRNIFRKIFESICGNAIFRMIGDDTIYVYIQIFIR